MHPYLKRKFAIYTIFRSNRRYYIAGQWYATQHRFFSAICRIIKNNFKQQQQTLIHCTFQWNMNTFSIMDTEWSITEGQQTIGMKSECERIKMDIRKFLQEDRETVWQDDQGGCVISTIGGFQCMNALSPKEPDLTSFFGLWFDVWMLSSLNFIVTPWQQHRKMFHF